jgi:hypothetical protein
VFFVKLSYFFSFLKLSGTLLKSENGGAGYGQAGLFKADKNLKYIN